MSILDLCILFKDAGIALLHDDGKISLEWKGLFSHTWFLDFLEITNFEI